MDKKASKRQYSTDDHDIHTITKDEWEKMEGMNSSSGRVYYHQSTYAGNGDKVW